MASRAAPSTRASTRTKPAPNTTTTTTTRATRARIATTKTTPPVVAVTSVKRTAIRKPLVNRENSVDADPAPKVPSKPIVRKAALKKQANVIGPETEREPIMAFLRIRPYLGSDEALPQPYLTPLSDTNVRMLDPNEQQSKTERFRSSTVSPSSIYTFSHVFPHDTTQSDFFSRTTLPLVRDVLQGQNGLLFTYGVTNSGKTYTVQGGTRAGSAGILPRTLDVIFNSIDGLHGDGKFRPVRLQGVELADPSDFKPPHVLPEPSLTEVLGQPFDISASDTDIDPTVLKVDRNYEYTIWLSYAEVYNEKVYDLLESVKNNSDNAGGAIPRVTASKSMFLTRTALPLKPSPASDNGDSAAAGKYISGLRQFRVHSASQAKALVKLGQLHRRVFGTLANSESSRSHGMVIIKVVRGHRGEKDDPTSLQISRLTLVDLAGSERTKHTHTTGDRLREAGNINKSLMVLGQCMEVMRSNQRKLAMSLAHEGSGQDGRMDTRDVRKTLAVIPFRHSKLTEALMDYFIGDGRAVMIVNVNPYDTGYDENSHVMRFSALAREVYVTPAPAPVHRMKGLGKVNGTTIKELGPMTLKDPDIVPLPPSRRKVTISMGGRDGRKLSETIVEVLEEDEPNDEKDNESSDDEPINPLVDALFDEVEHLRLQLFESEMRCAIIEAETREEVMREMEERMRSMEEVYSRRLMKELEQNELKTDAKIDMLHRSGLFASPVKRQILHSPPCAISEEEVDVEMSLIEYGEDEEPETSEISRSPSLSPLAKKSRDKSQETLDAQSSMPKVIREVREFVPDQPLPSDNGEAELTETESTGDDSMADSGTVRSEVDEDEDYDDDAPSEENDEDEWVPSSSARSKTSKFKVGARLALKDSTAPAATQVAKLARGIDELSLKGPDDSMVILPIKKSPRGSSNSDDDDNNDGDNLPLPAVKKKKRQLGKKPVMTEEEIERTTSVVERNAANAAGRNSIRRLTGL